MNTSHSGIQSETNAATPTARAQYIQLIFIIGALSAFGPLSIDMYLPGLPSLSQDLGATASEAQLTLTASLAWPQGRS